MKSIWELRFYDDTAEVVSKLFSSLEGVSEYKKKYLSPAEETYLLERQIDE